MIQTHCHYIQFSSSWRYQIPELSLDFHLLRTLKFHSSVGIKEVQSDDCYWEAEERKHVANRLITDSSVYFLVACSTSFTVSNKSKKLVSFPSYTRKKHNNMYDQCTSLLYMKYLQLVASKH